MTSMLDGIRSWVRGHAQDYILEYFSHLTTRRKEAHATHIHRITERAAYYYNARPHPSEIAAADQELKRGIDEDWRSSVQRYPEVLEYFYGLVDLNLPGDDEAVVKDPPLSALAGGQRKVRLREPERRISGGGRSRRPPAPSSAARRPGATFAPSTPQYGYGASGY